MDTSNFYIRPPKQPESNKPKRIEPTPEVEPSYFGQKSKNMDMDAAAHWEEIAAESKKASRPFSKRASRQMALSDRLEQVGRDRLQDWEFLKVQQPRNTEEATLLMDAINKYQAHGKHTLDPNQDSYKKPLEQFVDLRYPHTSTAQDDAEVWEEIGDLLSDPDEEEEKKPAKPKANYYGSWTPTDEIGWK